jgi:hypothetical protein
MSESEKNKAVNDLINVLIRKCGNKRYLQDLEVLLNKLDLSKEDEQTIYFLIQDIAD